MKNILILNTGGTIAMADDPETNAITPLSPPSLSSILRYVSDFADVKMEQLFNLPSPHMTFFEMEQLANTISTYLDEGGYDGIVVTHGTDTLEETAYYLDLVLTNTQPVVLTGAMRSQNELGADGPSNIVSAVRVATSDASVGQGTLVVFNDEIHAARFVTKTHTSNISTFRSPATGPIGHLTKKEVVFQQTVAPTQHLPSIQPGVEVALIKAAAGTNGDFIKVARECGYQGLVIEALGQGNLPPHMLPALEEALQAGMVIVVVSRCYNGFVEDSYGYEGGGHHLKQLGCLLVSGLNGQKARVKLTLALSAKDKDVRQYFQQ
ncbi:asparaginase [Mechercharimyces sp. CAU 1602]|uniref:asparaginase n=1 Tax=Mechercharimyces sp. CAU 1602 TaxID=2973933 RepID=UPI0021629098|nr:asparaginase [Mechercharimyces sp. CAU 1602]MCS1350960.1 asparaginase [Mechercharimyces sp. CAU 1602]